METATLGCHIVFLLSLISFETGTRISSQTRNELGLFLGLCAPPAALAPFGLHFLLFRCAPSTQGGALGDAAVSRFGCHVRVLILKSPQCFQTA